MDLGSMFSDMQEKMKKVKTDLEVARLQAEAGEGKVQVSVSGSKKLLEVVIAPAMMKEESREELEDLLVVAVNRAMDKADAKAAEAMQEVTGGMLPGMGLPGLF